MRIVVDVSHPAHVHYFKNFIWMMEKKGHDILVTASEKNVTYQLLDDYGFDYTKLGSYGSSLVKMLANIGIMDFRMYQTVRQFKPDLIIGLGSIRSAHVSFLINKPSVIIEDSEHTKLQNWLYRPFATVILSSHTFKDSYGKKHIKYPGFDELAYLHPRYFKPDHGFLEKMQLKPDCYVILRLISWNASHDVNQSGFGFQSVQELTEFIVFIESYGYRVLISSEDELPSSLQRYSIKIPPECVHDLLYFAHMYIGEGATMAAEAAEIGTPSIYVSSLSLGYLDDLRDQYGLVHTCVGCESCKEVIQPLLSDVHLKEQYQVRRNNLLKDQMDITGFLVWFVENYPESCKVVNSDKFIFERFR